MNSNGESGNKEEFPSGEESYSRISQEVFGGIKDLISDSSGLDIGNYKDKCIMRRIAVRVRARKCGSDEEYLEILKQEEEEKKALLKALTINVTQFFRNLEVFEKIREVVLPVIFENKAGDEHREVRIWSAGCSSGEEPYSMAIILAEYFKKDMARCPVYILATDFDHEVIAKGREGVYNEKSLLDAPSELVEKYFTKLDGGMFKIDDGIRKMVSFKRRNIFELGTHIGQDLIICRNMLIYFSRDQQQQILMSLAESLNDGGFLVLGKAETLISESRSLFKSVSTRERIYRKINFNC